MSRCSCTAVHPAAAPSSRCSAAAGVAAGSAAAHRDRRARGRGRPTCAPTPCRRSRARRSTPTRGVYGAGRLLVRFEGYVTNVGQGPLEVSGNPQTGSTCASARGRRRRGRATPVGGGRAARRSSSRSADGHDHFHLKNAMRYSLWNLEKTAQVAPGQKAGFCLYDIEDAPSPAPAAGPAGVHGGRHAVLRAGRPRARPSCAWARRRAGATCTTSTSPTSGWTCRARRPGRTWWARRPTRRTASGRAAARPRSTRRPSRARR